MCIEWLLLYLYQISARFLVLSTVRLSNLRAVFVVTKISYIQGGPDITEPKSH